jgi:Na+/proline symporter
LVHTGDRRSRYSDGFILLANQVIRMNSLDWVVLFGTIAFIVVYGIWKTRKTQTVEGYLRGDDKMRWWMIGVSIMATQASAVTFLSTPGQAIEV